MMHLLEGAIVCVSLFVVCEMEGQTDDDKPKYKEQQKSSR